MEVHETVVGDLCVTSTNHNATYHLVVLDEMRMVVPVVWKRIKAFKKRQEVEQDPEVEDEDTGMDEEPVGNGSEEDD